MINLNPNVSSVTGGINLQVPKVGGGQGEKGGFSETVKAVGKYVSEVDQAQHSSDMSINDLLTGKNEDIVSVVSEFAKADMSFKLLVGVRNKLIEAYKQTMNMPL